MSLDARSVWLTESFFPARRGKILPANVVNEPFIAAHAIKHFRSNYLNNNHFSRWHGFRFFPR
jgi:hypothetical protein